jgi:hypothetical protein
MPNDSFAVRLDWHLSMGGNCGAPHSRGQDVRCDVPMYRSSLCPETHETNHKASS